MKFGKLTLVVAAMLSVSAMMQAEVKLKIREGVVGVQKSGGYKEPLISIKLDKNKGFCYTQPSTGGHQICLGNDIAFNSAGPEDRFNFDKWYEKGSFIRVETMQWQETSYWEAQQNEGKPYIRSCQAIINGEFNKDKTPNAEVEFDDSCGIKIFNPKTGAYIPTVSFIFNEKTGKWEFASLTQEDGKGAHFAAMMDFPQLKAQWELDSLSKIPESAKAMWRSLNYGKK